MLSSSGITLRLRHFYHWWIAGLASLIPEAWRRRLQPHQELITFEFREDQVVCKFYTSNASTAADIQSFSLEQDASEKNVLQSWLQERITNTTEIRLLIPDEKVLYKRLTLPGAAGENLRQVLKFEMDRITPFQADQVYFDCVSHIHPDKPDNLDVHVFISPRAYIDELVQTLSNWKLKPHSITSTQMLQTSAKLNLLPAELNAQQAVHANQFTFVLAATALGLLIAILYVPLVQQEQAIESLQAQMEKSRSLALHAKELENRRNNMLEKSSFIATKRNEHLPVILILDELTRILPDNSWLSRLTITNDEIQIQGESDAASVLVQAIDSSGYFMDTQFSSPVTKNELTRQDKFAITTKLEITK